MKKYLFLDDERFPIDCAKFMYNRGVDCRIYHEEWTIVRSYGQFVQYIEQNGLPDLISFDHDLGDVPKLKTELAKEEWFNYESNKEYTGMDCAKWLVNYCLDNKCSLPKYIVHSWNTVGAENIKGLLVGFEKFSWQV